MAESSHSLPEVSLSQETASWVDIGPLWREVLPLALIDDLTDCLRSPCLSPPTILHSPALWKGPGISGPGRETRNFCRQLLPRVLLDSPGRGFPKSSAANALRAKLPNVVQMQVHCPVRKSAGPGGRLSDRGAGLDPGPGLLH